MVGRQMRIPVAKATIETWMLLVMISPAASGRSAWGMSVQVRWAWTSLMSRGEKKSDARPGLCRRASQAIIAGPKSSAALAARKGQEARYVRRSEEHTSELQSHSDLVCR